MSDETIGELHDRLPEDQCVDLPEYGVRVRRWPDPDPSTETWREAVGKSTSAKLRETQAALAASQADLTRMEAERDEALAKADRLRACWWACSHNRDEITADRDAISLIADQLRAELTEAQQELTRLRGDCAYKPLAVTAIQERDRAHAAHEATYADWEATHARLRDANADRGRLQALLDDAIFSRDWAVADKPVGPCAACSRPIVRGQAYRPLADAKGYFVHVLCQIEEKAACVNCDLEGCEGCWGADTYRRDDWQPS